LNMECKISFDPLPMGNDDSSCGLGFWYSERALQWTSGFLHARPAHLLIKDGPRQATLAMLVRSLPGGLGLASTYPYGRIEGDHQLFWEHGRLFQHELRSNRIVKLEIAFTAPYFHQSPVRLPKGSPFHRSTTLDCVRHVLELPPDTKKLDRLLGRKIRWAVGKAQRNGCKVKTASMKDLGTVQNIYADTMRAKGAPVNYGIERFSGIAEILRPLGQGEMFLGLHNGKPAGMAALVGDNKTAHLIQVAVLPQHQGTRLGELLIHTAIRHAVESEYRYFDFMASPREDRGLIAFKAKWATHTEEIRYWSLPSHRLLAKGLDFARLANQKLGMIRAR